MVADDRPVSAVPYPLTDEPPGRAVAAGAHTYWVVTLGPDGSADTGSPERGTPDAGTPEARPPAVVFLHGGGPGTTGWTDWGPVAPLFAADRRIHLVDLLQYGRSDKQPISGPRWSYLAASLVELLDELGEDRVDVVCNSWGGTIGIALAGEFPERVRSMVVTGSMPIMHGPLAPLPERAKRGRNVRNRYYGDGGPTADKMRELIATMEWYDEALIPDELVTRRYEQSLDAGEVHLASQSDELRGEWQNLEPQLRAIRCRTLFCWGMYDAFLTPDYPLMLANMVAHGQLLLIDQASHHPAEERPWDYYVMVNGFLAQSEPLPPPEGSS